MDSLYPLKAFFPACFVSCAGEEVSRHPINEIKMVGLFISGGPVPDVAIRLFLKDKTLFEGKRSMYSRTMLSAQRYKIPTLALYSWWVLLSCQQSREDSWFGPPPFKVVSVLDGPWSSLPVDLSACVWRWVNPGVPMPAHRLPHNSQIGRTAESENF